MITTKFRFAERVSKTKKEQKKELRTYVKKRRMENDNRDVKEDLLIENFYRAVFDGKTGAGMRRTFFIYLSFSSEAPTDRLIEQLKEDGHKICCPRIENGEMIAVEYGEDFTLSSFGIREPVGQAYEGEIDVAVIPFLAVDRAGNRLGYGGGYYDRFLKKTKAKRVAYGYDFQVVKSVPTEAWDEKVHVVVTNEDVIEVE